MDVKLKSHFLSIYHMALENGNVDPRELAKMYALGLKYGVTKDEINEAVIEGGTAFYKPETNEERIIYLYDLAETAWADGEIDDAEVMLLREYALKFDIDANQVNDFVDFLLEKVHKGVAVEEIINEIC
jgi:uncharacterized tellurite resistance protein B-like protein